MWRMSFGMVRAIALTFAMAHCCKAQTLNIWPGVAPGSETWTQKERLEKNTPLGAVVFNVVTPTLTIYLPERTKATGTGIIVAPGGAFVALAIDMEGQEVACWLQSKGIAAFVLKYRIIEKHGEGIPPDLNMDEAGKYGIADGIQALKVVGQNAAEWGISPRPESGIRHDTKKHAKTNNNREKETDYPRHANTSIRYTFYRSVFVVLRIRETGQTPGIIQGHRI